MLASLFVVASKLITGAEKVCGSGFVSLGSAAELELTSISLP